MKFSSTATHPVDCHCERCRKESGSLPETVYIRFNASKRSGGCQCGHGYCPRRIHVLSGLLLGVFLLTHLAINFLGLWPVKYNDAVGRIHRSEPVLVCFEILLVFIPLAVHAGFGIYLLKRFGLAYGVSKHSHGSNARYFWQRLTAVSLLGFLLFHIGTLHRWGFHALYKLTGWDALQRYAAGGLFNPSHDPFTAVVNGIGHFWNPQLPCDPGNFAVVSLYFVGIVAAVYHFVNGLSTGAMVLHWTKSRGSEKKFWYICLAAGCLLLVMGLVELSAFTMTARGR